MLCHYFLIKDTLKAETFPGWLFSVWLDSSKHTQTGRSSLPTLPMLYLPFNVYLDSKRVSILIEAVLPTLPMLYLPFNVYLDPKRVSILIEAVLPTLPMLYLPFNVYLDSKRVKHVPIEAILPTLPVLYLPFKQLYVHFLKPYNYKHIQCSQVVEPWLYEGLMSIDVHVHVFVKAISSPSSDSDFSQWLSRLPNESILLLPFEKVITSLPVDVSLGTA